MGVVGDSLVVLAQSGPPPLDYSKHSVTDALTGLGFYESTAALIGADSDDLFGAHSSSFVGFPSPGADIQIIALGTNDAHDNAVPVDRYESNLRRWIDSQPSATCFGLVNIFTGATGWRLDVTAPAYNEVINRIVADHPNVHLIDWNAFALAHPSFFSDTSGPHPNAGGQAAYRLLIALGATSCAATLDSQGTDAVAR